MKTYKTIKSTGDGLPQSHAECDASVAPLNLTGIVLFTAFICSASLVVDDLFFRHNHLSLVEHLSGDTTSSLLIQEDDQGINIIITASTVREKHAAVHGGAMVILLAIVFIWFVSAYMSLVQKTEDFAETEFSAVHRYMQLRTRKSRSTEYEQV